MKPGIGSYAFRYAIGFGPLPSQERMTLSRLLEYCNTEKIEVMQVCDNIPLHKISDTELQDGLALSEKYGIELEIGTTGFSCSHLKKYLEIAKFFHSKILRTVLNAGNENSREDISQQIRQLIPFLESSSISLAIENHFDLTPFELHKLIGEFNHPLVKICIDPLNSISLLWGMQETLGQLKRHIVSAHVKDVKVKRKGAGFLITGCPLGEGVASVADYIAQVYRVNPVCNIFLEQWMDPHGTMKQTIDEEKKWVTDGMIYLNQIVSGL
jgi:3-oxoisoapionate decarboxylase